VASDDDRLVGFSYLESWGYDKFVANFGLIVDPEYRNNGLARKVKHKIFELSRKLYPDVRIFSSYTGLALIAIQL
jgi:ribosomal protein S18 acetylase RimI-like enzyme